MLRMPLDPDPSTSPILRPVMPELDAMRGVAVVLVVLHHAFYWAHVLPRGGDTGTVRMLADIAAPGQLGVQLFFVLSGLLITGILLDSRERPDYYRRFYLRRALRILPAYLLLLAVLVISGRVPLRFALLAGVFAANLSPLLGVPLAYSPLWSLGVEEQYYLLWPVMVRGATRGRLLLIATALLVLAPWLRWMAFRFGSGAMELNWRLTWFAYGGLLLGSLVAILLRSPHATRSRVKMAALSALAAAVVAGIAGIPYGLWDRQLPLGAALQLTVVNLFFASVLVLSLLAGSGRWRWLVTQPWLMFLGYISYGLYLCHVLVIELYDRVLGPPAAAEPIAELVRFVVVAAASVLIAWLSRRYYEEPFLRLGRRPPAVPAAMEPMVPQE